MVCLKQKDSSTLLKNAVIERVFSQGRRMWPLARESADPQVRRVGSLGKHTEGKRYRTEASKTIVGDWGLVFPGVPMAQLGSALLLLFMVFPAREPFRASRGWDCDTWTSFSSRFVLPEPRVGYHAQLVKAIRPRFQRATSTSPAP